MAKKKYYRVGDRIKISTGEFSTNEYILAYTGRSKGDSTAKHFNRGQVSLINLEDGTRWDQGVDVDNIYKIHYTELYEIIGEEDFREDWTWEITFNHKAQEIEEL